jgi:hypothetical protein
MRLVIRGGTEAGELELATGKPSAVILSLSPSQGV